MIAALVGLVLVSAAPPQTLGEALARLRKPKSLTAEFEQTKTMKMLREPMKARGRLFILEPDQIKWEMVEPYKMTFILSKSKASMIYPDLGRSRSFKVEDDPETKALFDTILFFVNVDEASLRARFEVDFTPGVEAHIALVPKSEAARKVVARVELWLDDERGTLRQLAMTQSSGSRTVWRFEHVKLDPPIDPATFEP